jgi:hypothetical protein
MLLVLLLLHELLLQKQLLVLVIELHLVRLKRGDARDWRWGE